MRRLKMHMPEGQKSALRKLPGRYQVHKAWVLATQKDVFSLFMLVFSNLLYRMSLVQPIGIS